MCLMGLTCLLCPTFEMAAQWQKIRLGMLEINEHIHNIVFTSPDDCYLSLDKGIIRSLERGRWTKRTIIDGSIREIVFPTPTVGYAVGSKVWKTTNAGDTWQLAENQPQCWDTEGGALVATSVDKVLIAAGWCGVLTTSDRGASWQQAVSNSPVGLLRTVFVAESKDSIIWLLSTVGGATGYGTWIYHSSNAGSYWFSNDSWLTYDVGSAGFMGKMIKFADSGNGMIVGHRSSSMRPEVAGFRRVFRTRNAGERWDTVGFHFASNVNCIAFANERVGYIGDVAGNIYSTSDGGETWHNENAPSEGRAINAITVTTGGEVYAVGEYGILLRRDLPTSVTEAQLPTTLRLYPNPTTGVVTVESDFGPAQLFVVDVLGTVVLQVQAESKTTIDLSAYPPGMYRVIAQSSAGICAETVAVVR